MNIKEIERITVLEQKVDNMDKKLSDHIDRQDKFEEKILCQMEDLTLILKAFKFIGWAITIGLGTGIAWFVNHLLNK